MNSKQYHAAAAAYLADRRAAGWARATIENNSTTLSLFGRFAEQRGCDPATAGAISAFKIYLAENGRTAATIRQRMGHLKLFYSYCCAVDILNSNPARPQVIQVKKAQNSRPYSHTLGKEDILRILSATEQSFKGVPQNLRPRNKAILTLLITAGLRNSEIRALRLCDLDFTSALITIEHGKGDKFRRVSFPQITQAAVRSYLNSSTFPAGADKNTLLFGQTRKNGEWQEISRQGFSEIVRRSVLILTGIDGIRSHALRHAYASVLLAGGVDKNSIQELLGHSCIATTERYIEQLMPNRPAEIANSVFTLGEEEQKEVEI